MKRHSPIPLYYQIKTRLLEAIESGQLKVGDRIPSERELTERYEVSRMTARQALVELESMGYLRRIQGKGTFVSIPKFDQPLLSLTSFSEDMIRRGLTPGGEVISMSEVAAGRKVAQALDIPETEPVFQLERLRLAGGEPMALETTHLPASIVPGLLSCNLENQSLYAVLKERYGLKLERATQSIEAVAVPTGPARLLKVREGSPVLQMERVSIDDTGRRVEFVRSLYRGDRYRFTTELLRPDILTNS